MEFRAIRTEEDLTWALAEVERYFQYPPAKGTDDAARFDILSDLIEAYENKHWPIEETPISAPSKRPLNHKIFKKRRINPEVKVPLKSTTISGTMVLKITLKNGEVIEHRVAGRLHSKSVHEKSIPAGKQAHLLPFTAKR